MPATVEDTLIEIKATFEGEFKTAQDRADIEFAALGVTTGETKARVDAVSARLDELEADARGHAARVALGVPKDGEGEAKQWDNFLRNGETKGLTVGNDVTGGYLAPTEMVQEILKGIVLWSPIREYARVRQTGTGNVDVPKRTGTLAARWVSEQGSRTETTGTQFGLERIPSHELYARVDISFADLEDSEYDLEGYIREEMQEQFGVGEGAAFITGTGIGKPEGILQAAGVQQVNSGLASAINLDSVMDLEYSLKSAYRRRGAVFGCATQTVATLRKLKDVDGNYLWGTANVAGESPTLDGFPVIEFPDMPVVAANSLPMFFGSLRDAYLIVDRAAFAFQRDEYTQVENGAVKFNGRRRVGGAVVNSEAVKIMKVAV